MTLYVQEYEVALQYNDIWRYANYDCFVDITLTVVKIDHTSLPMWEKRCYIQTTFDIPNYQITSVFYVFDIGLCNCDSKFQA